jgi:hypothetical protein
MDDGPAYSKRMMSWSTAKLSPSLAQISETIPSCAAEIVFSIFIASIEANF